MTPAAVAAMCADYRASFHRDKDHDAEDRDSGRRITAPVLVVTGAEETQLADAGDVWREWATTATPATAPGGDFVPEESPAELLDLLVPFLTT
jgi:haloacetate dehalogenase